jgi:pilus assembly protein CpaC
MTRKFTSAVAGLILVVLVAGPEARQQTPSFGNGVAVAPRDSAAAATVTVNLLVGRSTILDIGGTIARVSLTVPDIADAMVTSPTQLLVHGKQPGTISMFVWDKMGGIKTYEVVVRRDLSSLVEHVKQLFPGEPITVAGSGKDVVLSGTVTSKYVIDKAADVAGGYVEKKENIVNLLKQQEGVASNQVMLRVRFAEVSRNALQEVGASFFSDGKNNLFGRTTTQQFQAPYFDLNQPSAALGDSLVFSDYLNLFLFDAKNKIGAVVKALQTRGVFQSLAEPNLIAMNGKEASFLAGGEFPYPVPAGQFGSFTIHFKEYGVRLSFTPTVLGGDLINLKIKPEVSSLDFNNAVIIEGFRIPALTSRRAETEVELRDGQTFAIAGLLNNTALSSMRKVPGLGDIPILGHLFRSRAYTKDQTELVVMVTPQIMRRDSTGVSPGLPSLVEPFLGPNEKPIVPPAPYVGSPHPQSRSGGRGADSAPQPQQAPEPVATTPMQSAPQPQPAADKKSVEAEKQRQKKAAEAAEKQRVAEEKHRVAVAKQQAEADKVAAQKAEKLEKERVKQQAEADKKAEEARKKAADRAKKTDQQTKPTGGQ